MRRRTVAAAAILVLAISASAAIATGPERGADAWVFFQGDDVNLMGNAEDVARARTHRVKNENLLWFRRGGDAWTVRDRALLGRAADALAVVRDLARQQTELERRQTALGRRLTAAQRRKARIEARLAAHNPEADRARAEAEHADVLAELRQLAVEQERLDTEAAALATLTRRASDTAKAKLAALFESAIRSGAARKS